MIVKGTPPSSETLLCWISWARGINRVKHVLGCLRLQTALKVGPIFWTVGLVERGVLSAESECVAIVGVLPHRFDLRILCGPSMVLRYYFRSCWLGEFIFPSAAGIWVVDTFGRWGCLGQYNRWFVVGRMKRNQGPKSKSKLVTTDRLCNVAMKKKHTIRDVVFDDSLGSIARLSGDTASKRLYINICVRSK